jgi:Fe-S-cluster containining protein
MATKLPDACRPMSGSEKFAFSCHPDVPCFNECCRQIDLVLTPYDALRLKKRLKLDSAVFLERYIIVEWEEGMRFPHCFLTMVDDGKASCVFSSEQGCKVYEDRPTACRAYPAGRGASRRVDGAVSEQFVLVREPHCKGFSFGAEQTVPAYFQSQGLTEYNRFNDQLLQLLQHPKVRAGFRPTRAQTQQFILALYNVDMFRRELLAGRVKLKQPLSPMESRAVVSGDDKALLLLGVRWLLEEFFGEYWCGHEYRKTAQAA